MSQQPIYRDVVDAHEQCAHSNVGYVTETHLLGASRIGLMQIENNPPGHFPDPPMSAYTVTKQTRGTGQARIDLGASPIRRVLRRDDVTLAPPGVATDYQIDYTFSLEVISLPVATLRQAQDMLGKGHSVQLEQLHSDAFRDPYISATLSRMFEEARTDADTSALFVDQAVQSIAVALLAQAGRLVTQDFGAKPLDDGQLARITDILMDRLDERVSMDDLADALSYDVFRFSRAFKARTGMTPHKYLIELRLDRVAEQLRQTTDPIAEIAYSCGFSSQSHMTTAFSNRMGISPAVFRREARA